MSDRLSAFLFACCLFLVAPSFTGCSAEDVTPVKPEEVLEPGKATEELPDPRHEAKLRATGDI